MSKHRISLKAAAMAGAGVAALLSAAPAAYAQEQTTSFNIAEGPLSQSLLELGRQARISVAAPRDVTAGRTGKPVQGELTTRDALLALLEGSGLTYDFVSPTAVRVDAPQGASASDGADGTVEALIVTAQKREEDIQDVPIAISAFTQEQLENSQVAGGPDLMTQVPNFTFTKTNFTSYSIQIRGIGTQAISATTDPAVAIAFNNTPFVRNRFFEQEFYDLQRVEVLRGPQGTLYGRNATAGVVNIISQKPKFNYEAKLSGDVSNYSSTRLEGMINLPLVEDRVAVRLAGAWTKREGFVTNEITGNPIDGRDLWSTRLSLRFSPTDRLDANLIWEHFEEDDDRLRSGKQLCKKHVVTEVGGIPVTYFQGLPDNGQGGGHSTIQSVFSQGCLPNSLYDEDSFQTPNGMSIPYYWQLQSIGLQAPLPDPYVSTVQSRDLRTIESTVDPGYRARTDIIELQFTYDLTDALSLTSETAWASDFIFSTQDFNRFNTAPGAFSPTASLVSRGILDENGVFCDPQIGCADRLVAVDLSTATSHHFSQELRLGSNFDGPFNFSLGGNFLRYDTEDKYYVFINTISQVAAINSNLPYEAGVSTNYDCLFHGDAAPDLADIHGLGCTYIDPNPINNLDDRGHNYFLSRNPFKLISYAVFGEAYYNVTDNLKVTAGLRWTVDKKEAPRIPSWILAGQTVGYPVQDVTEQEWREPTGRLTVDWKPDLAFTDETLLYWSFAHGYKAGGANPPPFGVVMYCPQCGPQDFVTSYLAKSATHPRTFDAEFVDAFEVGSKNTLLDGRVTLNLAAFYYDYAGYQISQIVNRSAVNHNFDAKVWGLEIEADWRPLENLRLGFKGGYENTRVADGERAIDVMDRTAGKPGWSVIRPFPTFPSNCILPTSMYINADGSLTGLGGPNGGNPGGCEIAYVLGRDPVTNAPYVPDPTACGPSLCKLFALPPGYAGFDPFRPDIHFGEGFDKELGGNELPNAPNFTATITADYTVPLPSDWLMTLHTDLYYQSEAWTRIFNTPGYDKLKAYTNVNLAAIFTNDAAGWKVMAYVKNVFDRDSITGAFLNSDDTGLTTNVFLTEPRLYGLRVTKDFRGGPWWTGAPLSSHTGPYPLTVEIGGQIQRQDAPYVPLEAGFEDLFPEELDIFAGAQNRDLDWGDGREAKLTWRPGGGPWMVSGAFRYGRTNTDTARPRVEVATETQCLVAEKYFPFFGGNVCDPSHPFYEQVGGGLNRATFNWASASARTQEKHELADFSVGRDFGLGGLSRSTVSAGLRYATFESETWTTMAGAYDRYIRDGWFLPGPQTHPFHEYDGAVESQREFDGLGPVVSWEAAVPLLGDDRTGRLQFDWSLGGGVLMGKQETKVDGDSRLRNRSLYIGQEAVGDQARPVSTVDIPPFSFSRSEDVTVPVAALSLGLAYDIQRIRVGAGYRWERYFDVLDVGFDEAEQADRTIDGPYFKLSVGFGG
jgi:outer membrane receptor protein involved in Fe transport